MTKKKKENSRKRKNQYRLYRLPRLNEIKIKLVDKVRYSGDTQPGCYYRKTTRSGKKVYVIEINRRLPAYVQWAVFIHELTEMLDMIMKGVNVEYHTVDYYDKLKAHNKANIIEYCFREILKIPHRKVQEAIKKIIRRKKLLKKLERWADINEEKLKK